MGFFPWIIVKINVRIALFLATNNAGIFLFFFLDFIVIEMLGIAFFWQGTIITEKIMYL